MAKNTPVPEGFDEREWLQWDQKSKDKLLAALSIAEKSKKAWYCKRGRKCDGRPHEGYDYKHARGSQWPPPGHDWLTWLMRGGRGSGKTRTGSEWTRVCAMKMPYVSIIGPTWKHVRRYMIEGPSGLLKSFAAAGIKVTWEPSNQLIIVPCFCSEEDGSHEQHIIQVFTGEEPDRLRGPEHYAVWLDEPAHMPLIEAVWDMMLLGLRQGEHPHVLCTTTPLPTKWIKNLIADKEGVTRTVSVTESTYANRDNLSEVSLKVYEKLYKGTRLGRQELYGEILEDIEGALWNWDMIAPNRIIGVYTYEDMDRVVVAIDPAGTSSKKRDETGIIVVGIKDGHYYVLADLSGHYTPERWAAVAWKAFDDFQADLIVAEKNYGGEMVLSTLRTKRKNGNIALVHSRRGKVLRAEPIVSLYEQQLVHHTQQFEDLETQQTEWVPDAADSPDRVDALVHGITELSGGAGPSAFAVPTGKPTTPESGLPGFRDSTWRTAYLQQTLQAPIFGYRPREAPVEDSQSTVPS